jgi:hypothetical protein
LCNYRKVKEAELRALQEAMADADAVMQLEMELRGMELEQVRVEACCLTGVLRRRRM